MKELDLWYHTQTPELREFYLALRLYILQVNPNISEAFKYKLPFFSYKNKMCCYLWYHKKYKQPYIGIVAAQHIQFPGLLQEDRKQMKILLLNPNIDLPIADLNNLFTELIGYYDKILKK